MRNVIVICGLSRLADDILINVMADIPEQAAIDWPDDPEEKISCRLSSLCSPMDSPALAQPLWVMSSQINQVRPR
jgi:hypothetical protein